MANRVAVEMEGLRQKYGVTAPRTGLYVGWSEGMTRRSARKIARVWARKTKKAEREKRAASARASAQAREIRDWQ